MNPCTFNTTRKSFTQQFWYGCITCSDTPWNSGCCMACVTTCHKGHKLIGPKYSPFYCDCGSGELVKNKDSEPFKCLNVVPGDMTLRPFNPTTHHGITFYVDGDLNMVPNSLPTDELKIDGVTSDNIIASSFPPNEPIINGRSFESKFLECIEFAYSNHLPLKLSPSHFLLMISQGLATHINENAEELRQHLVNYEGKKELLVEMHDYQYGMPYDWTKIFDTFTELIKKDVNSDIYDVVKDEFSCSTPVMKACADVALMDCMKSFCEYYGSCSACGIKRVTLDGTPDDWKIFRDKVYKLAELNKDNSDNDKLKLGWWLDALLPVVDKICEAAIDHKIDPDFWRRIYSFDSGSGYAYASGWITVFFPYLKNDDKVRGGKVYITKKHTNMDWANNKSHIDVGNDPSNISSVDFTLKYSKEFTADIKMKFHAGFFGSIQYDDLTVEPMLGWVVSHSGEKPK